MSNGFDCNINNASINKLNKVQSEKNNSGSKQPKQESEYKEGSSLNLSPSAIAGRSMINVNLQKKKPIMNREQFEQLAEQKMSKNLLYTDSKAFIPELLAQIKPEEQEDFLKWTDFCNKYAETASQTYNTWTQDNDRWAVVKNFKSFAGNPVLKTNLDDCMKLIETYKNHEEDVNDINISHLILQFIENKEPNDIQNHLRAIDVLENNFVVIEKSYFGNETVKNATLSSLSTTTPEDILKLEPIAKKVKLDISIPQHLSYMKDVYGYEAKDENIQRTADAMDGINENSENINYMRKIIKEMIFSGDDKFNEYNKWIHYINDEIPLDLNFMPLMQDKLDTILFKDKKEYGEMYGDRNAEQLELFEKLTQNTEIFDALRNLEIDTRHGLFYFDANRYEEGSFKDIEEIKKIGAEVSNAQIIESILSSDSNNLIEILATKSKKEIFECLDKVEKMKKTTQSNPKLYLNGNDNNPRMIEAKIQDFYDNNSVELIQLVSTFDKEPIDVLMRKRFDDFQDYLDSLKEFSSKDMNLLKELCNSVNIDGKPFLPTQKIEFIDLIEGYKNNRLDTTPIEEMVQSGKIDLAKLKIDLFNKIMKNAGLSDEEISAIPKEKLTAWDTKYAHLLAKGYTEIDEYDEVDATGFNDILRGANLYDFESYINDESNVYGKANANTKQMFSDMNLNYDKWVHPSKSNEIDFISSDKNQEQLFQIASQITEDMNTLMQTPVKGHIKKQFPSMVKGNEFIIPSEYFSSKSKMSDFLRYLTDETENGKMSAVWKRAKGNLNSPDPERVKTAQSTVTILDHLNQRVKDLDKVENINIEKSLNWKIKMWDRVPQKDLFQGNYSTCCIGVGNGNGHAMPHYLMNTAYNMIEIVDNENGKTVGNALCYFVKTDDGKPAFVIDNVEINNSDKPSDTTGKSLREKIFQYASNIAKEVTGQDNVPIFLSDQYNDIPYLDMPSHEEKISFLGDIDCENIYMDMFSEPAEWTSRDDLTQTCKVLTLNDVK